MVSLRVSKGVRHRRVLSLPLGGRGSPGSCRGSGPSLPCPQLRAGTARGSHVPVCRRAAPVRDPVAPWAAVPWGEADTVGASLGSGSCSFLCGRAPSGVPRPGGDFSPCPLYTRVRAGRTWGTDPCGDWGRTSRGDQAGGAWTRRASLVPPTGSRCPGPGGGGRSPIRKSESGVLIHVRCHLEFGRETQQRGRGQCQFPGL